MPSLITRTDPLIIAPEALHAVLGRPDLPVLIDVTLDEDVDADPHLIPGAFRHPHREIAALSDRLRDRRVVAICQKGRKLSQGAAALLRRQGVEAYALEGGNVAWRDAGRPRVRIEALPDRDATGRTNWVAAETLDRLGYAAAWLIRRFVDPRAAVLFVETAEVDAVAERFAAKALLPSVRDGRVLTALLERLGLADDRLARFVARLEDDGDGPAVRGLFAALPVLHAGAEPRLEAALALCDLLYAASRTGLERDAA